jgi:hypothetical protein
MKRKKQINTFLISVLAIMISGCPGRAFAQGAFAYQAPLDSILQASFYRITLPPELVAKCRPDLGDLRISDANGKYIPFVIRTDPPVLSSKDFKEFPILSTRINKDSVTEMDIQNNARVSISSLLLIIKNASARRTCTLSGSDDRQKWFVIKEHIELEEAGSGTGDQDEAKPGQDFYMQAILFPASNYHFFRIILDDKGLLPLNILKAGMYTTSLINGRYLEIPDPAIRQKDSSNKHSYITVLYREPYRIDKLSLEIQGPALYNRHARIFDTGNSGSLLLADIQIDPKNTTFRIPSVKTGRLLIDIANEDNMPLIIQKTGSFQLHQYLLTYLQPGTPYYLLAGNELAPAPDYDLKYFIDSLTKHPLEARIGPLGPLRTLNKPAAIPVNDHSGILLWSIIAFILMLLIFLSFKMMKAIPGKEK